MKGLGPVELRAKDLHKSSRQWEHPRHGDGILRIFWKVLLQTMTATASRIAACHFFAYTISSTTVTPRGKLTQCSNLSSPLNP